MIITLRNNHLCRQAPHFLFRNPTSDSQGGCSRRPWKPVQDWNSLDHCQGTRRPLKAPPGRGKHSGRVGHVNQGVLAHQNGYLPSTYICEELLNKPPVCVRESNRINDWNLVTCFPRRAWGPCSTTPPSLIRKDRKLDGNRLLI